MTRDEFDALLLAAVTADVPPANPDDPASLSERQDAIREAELLDAEAREFADAVDRDGGRVPYTSAVVLEGTAGTVVVSEADYAATPVHWHLTAGGHVDRLIHGAELVAVLTKAAHRGPA